MSRSIAAFCTAAWSLASVSSLSFVQKVSVLKPRGTLNCGPTPRNANDAWGEWSLTPSIHHISSRCEIGSVSYHGTQLSIDAGRDGRRKRRGGVVKCELVFRFARGLTHRLLCVCACVR